MLEFIILGQVPGTSIYLSFADVASVMVAVGISIFTYKLFSPWRTFKKKLREIQEIAL